MIIYNLVISHSAIGRCFFTTSIVMKNEKDSCQNQASNSSSFSDTLENGIENLSLKCTNDASETALSLISNEFSKAGQFSIASICAFALGRLFPEKWDEAFCTSSIKLIIHNLQLPHKMESVMTEFIKREKADDYSHYLNLLRTEDCFVSEKSFEDIICCLITIAVTEGWSTGKYDSRWRVLILHLTNVFNVNEEVVDQFERKLVTCLLKKEEEITEEEQKKASNRRITAKAKRYALIGMATVGGGALIGITGGLAAPMIGTSIGLLTGGTAIGGAVATIAGSGVILGSLFGAAGGSLAGYKMHKRVGDIEEFEFCELTTKVEQEEKNCEIRTKSISKPKELHITIAISGWIKSKGEEHFMKPWTNLSNGREQYYLKYESSYLLELGKAMDYILSCVASVATQQMLKLTVLSSLMTAIMWPSWLLGLSSVIDNPWGVCLRRSSQVGKQLAEVLLARNQGHRPVTLLGYSLGARVIYYCLREMSNRKDCEGIIQDVILLGAPCTAQSSEWSKFNRVVAGRIVNGYCRGDWLLKFLYRTLSVAVDGVAGLQCINLENEKLHNVDLTDIVTGHTDYPERMTKILSVLGVRVTKTEEIFENIPLIEEINPSDASLS